MRFQIDCARRWRVGGWVIFGVAILGYSPLLGADAATPSVADTVQAVDESLEAELESSGTAVAPSASDEDFLRRVSFDLAGSLRSPRDVTLFGLDPDPQKRQKRIERLLASDDYAQNWMRYWRDVVFSRATNMRAQFARSSFEKWMTEQIEANTPWDKVATAMVTATGDVRENGETALIFAQEGDQAEVASEVSRIFLGIQIQCANCHDHPTDKWTRDDFHELAAFFPRIRVQPKREEQRLISYEVLSANPSPRGRDQQRNPEQIMRFLDKNRDGKLTKAEVANTQMARAFDQILARADLDKDKALSLEEFKKLPQPPMGPGRGSDEHYMADLENPGDRGRLIDPVFFLSEQFLPRGQTDRERRGSLSRWITSPDNPWFARAYVNRIWSELLGAGFYAPVDDIGPERTAQHPETLALLSQGFLASGYDTKWLFAVITNTKAYQRQVRPVDPTAPAFASATPTRLRSDQVYTAITRVFGIDETPANRSFGQTDNPYRRGNSARDGFNVLFGFDPSTPQADITGEIPQALFLMNSPQIHSLIQASGLSRLNQVLTKFPDNEDAIFELYLLVLAREPSDGEIAVCEKYIAKVDNRNEAFEDLLWSLLNSSEFLSKR